jgi:hypothetical protein
VNFDIYNERVSSMAKKQAIGNETAASAAPARTAKPRTPRVKAAQHSKAISAEPTIAPVPAVTTGNPHDAIALIAYRLWESRGYEHGSALEDWVRAEREYSELVAAR